MIEHLRPATPRLIPGREAACRTLGESIDLPRVDGRERGRHVSDADALHSMILSIGQRFIWFESTDASRDGTELAFFTFLATLLMAALQPFLL